MYILKFIDKLHLSVLNTTSLPFGTSIVDITITAKVINISSPNTPGLRMLQGRKQLKDLVKKVQAARDEMQWGDEGPPPLLVKITPDLSKDDLEDIAAILSNTTISRPDTVSSNPLASEAGGLSGKPLLDLSTNILKQMYILTRGKIPLIGCGGISSGEDAYKKIRSGATLVQLYTAFAYGGPALIPQMKVLKVAHVQDWGICLLNFCLYIHRWLLLFLKGSLMVKWGMHTWQCRLG
ncbi:dihydroorotate dehydrogenase (quinone), mitochondrial isoform X1 [Arachis hypogaea]|uniref:dihydroorotate dehydrogenase (quinone), mitochondrial isoform X1 n=1 Tax=Arachis hypogaea TaxID=3818 RepID=UPI003B215BA0